MGKKKEKTMEEIEEGLLNELKAYQELGDSLSDVLKEMHSKDISITAENICARFKKISNDSAKLVEAAVFGYGRYRKEFGPLINSEYKIKLGSFVIVGSVSKLIKTARDIDVRCIISGNIWDLPDQLQMFLFEHEGKRYKMQVLMNRFSEKTIEYNPHILRGFAGSVLRLDDSFEDLIEKARSEITVGDLYFLKKREIVKYLEEIIKKYKVRGKNVFHEGTGRWKVRGNKRLNNALSHLDSDLYMILRQDNPFDDRQVPHILNSFEEDANIIHEELDAEDWEDVKEVVLKTMLSLMKRYMKEGENLDMFTETEENIESLGK